MSGVLLATNIGLKAASRSTHDRAPRARPRPFMENMSLENWLPHMNLAALLRTEDPEELANHVLPNDGHLE
jgi:hypothetical protein